MKIHDLLEKRAAAVASMRKLAETAEAETRDLTADEDKRFDALKAEIGDLDKKIARGQALAEAERTMPGATIISGRGDGQFEQRAHEFNICRAIAGAIGEPGVDASFEREISQEVARRSGRKFNGIAVPDQVFMQRRAFGDQVMLTGSEGSPGAAWPLYPTQHRADLFIDKLRSSIIVGRLGATILDNLQGDQSIPKQTGSATAAWVAEDGALTDSALAFDDVELKPKTVGAITSYSRRTLINANPSIEQLVRNDLVNVIAAEIDRAALFGAGGVEPLGVIHQSGVREIDLSNGPTWTQVLMFIASIDQSDAAIGGLGWAMSPWSAAKFRATTKLNDDGSGGFLMEGINDLGGYPVAISSAIPGAYFVDDPTSDSPATIVFGAWSQMLVGYWSGTDILVNPYETEAFKRGRVMVRAMRDCDVAVRHPESFVYSDTLDVVPTPPST